MPFGVASGTYLHLPEEDRIGLRAGWIGAGGNPDGSGTAGGIDANGNPLPPPPPPPPPPSPAPPPVIVPPANLDTDALVPPGVNVPTGYLGGSVTLIPAPPVVSVPQPPPAASGDSADASDSGTLETFSLEEELRHDPGDADVKLPAGAWADLRDYIVKDQPFLGTHVRARGRGLRDVVASDLWTST